MRGRGLEQYAGLAWKMPLSACIMDISRIKWKIPLFNCRKIPYLGDHFTIIYCNF
jgi:hypothetical protein